MIVPIGGPVKMSTLAVVVEMWLCDATCSIS